MFVYNKVRLLRFIATLNKTSPLTLKMTLANYTLLDKLGNWIVHFLLNVEFDLHTRREKYVVVHKSNAAVCNILQMILNALIPIYSFFRMMKNQIKSSYFVNFHISTKLWWHLCKMMGKTFMYLCKHYDHNLHILIPWRYDALMKYGFSDTENSFFFHLYSHCPWHTFSTEEDIGYS